MQASGVVLCLPGAASLFILMVKFYDSFVDLFHELGIIANNQFI